MRHLAALVLLFRSTVASVQTYTPVRISYADLAKIHQEHDGSNGDENHNSAAKAILARALEDVGMISITDIPSFFGCKMKTLNSLRDCIADSSSSSSAVEHTFPDGTVRRTIASHCVAGKAHKIQHHDDPSKSGAAAACGVFDNASENFRQVVATVTDTLAMSLEAALNIPSGKTLLVSKSRSFSLVETIQQGEHLEHFHSYESPQAPSGDETIEWHLDQGLALIFTPGLIKNTPADGFYIRLGDGSEVMVNFEPQDELVVLLGDGVNQYVNPILESSLRPVPHSLRMPKAVNNGDLSRVWYGRMVLPPPSAIHPVHQKTFGDLRNAMMTTTNTTKDNHEEALDLGCSSGMTARNLNEITCEEGTFFCWHRCFDHTEEVSPVACESQNLDLACINEARELWDGIHDDSFFPGCVDLATALNYTRVDATSDGIQANAAENDKEAENDNKEAKGDKGARDKAADANESESNATSDNGGKEDGLSEQDTTNDDSKNMSSASMSSCASVGIGMSQAVFGTTILLFVIGVCF